MASKENQPQNDHEMSNKDTPNEKLLNDEIVELETTQYEDKDKSNCFKDKEFAWEIDDGPDDEVTIVQDIKKDQKALSTVPAYRTDFTGFLTEKEYSMETGQHIKNDCAPKRTCFNCLGDHNINECKEKKDTQAILRNKKSILGKRPAANVRYHEDVENKFRDFAPGKISENLRNALGLEDSQPPEFIYRMRVLGYPPGWLKDAEIKRSEVSLIDGTGKPLCDPDEEEGETDRGLTKYQPEKMISFPGFNVPFPSHIKDKSNQLRYPPMQKHHMKENFLSFMKMNRATKYKRKKLKPGDTPQSSDVVRPPPGDMEVDNSEANNSIIEFNPPLPKEDPPKPPEPPPLPPSDQNETKEEGELSEEDSNEAKTVAKPEERTNSNSSPLVGDEIKVSLKRKERDFDDENVEQLPHALITSKQHKSSSKGFTLGVVIPESITDCKQLPDPSKWSVDVSDHILFDNLPDALGTWQKMKGIVKTVQKTLLVLHAENEADC